MFFYFLPVAMPLARPSRPGRAAPYSLEGLQPGLPRPQWHVYARPVMLVVNQEPSVQQCSAGDGWLGLGIVSRPSWMHACAMPLAPPQGSAKEAEEQGWRKWADRWLTELAPCLSSAPSFAALIRRFSSEIFGAGPQRKGSRDFAKAFAWCASLVRFCAVLSLFVGQS